MEIQISNFTTITPRPSFHHTMPIEPFYVSAPGKVILFGEHSAVYGKPAIAAALDLRAYLLVTGNADSELITLNFPDIQLQHSWKRSDIPWDELTKFVNTRECSPGRNEELVPEIVSCLSTYLEDIESKLHYTACFCFLYLYVHLCGRETPGATFCVRSTLPIGAGLGSSAATSVCLASAMSMLGKYVSPATHALKDRVSGRDTKDADFIDFWSLVGEKCFHGNPSGIDNAVATHGGAVMYQRMKNPAEPSIRMNMRNFPSLKLLLTNTKIPRSTAALVKNVSRINTDYPKIAAPILTAMEHLATEAYQIMVRPLLEKEEKQTLQELININHGLLVSLGVSHPSLEKIKALVDTFKIGATKLTGAGGGGCAITLVDEDVEESRLSDLVDRFEQEGFDSFETSLGGKGVGLLKEENLSTLSQDMFDSERFSSLATSSDVCDLLAPVNVDGWRFW